MIRFKPDTFWEAVLRPVAMVAPDANVYVEIAAPDLRFAVAVLLAVAALVFWRRLERGRAAVVALLLLLALAFIPWLETSGNGRYFVPVLLMIGPLIAALIHWLPLTKAFRLFLMTGTVAAQLTILALNPPWGAWAWLEWRDAPYFQIDHPAQEPTGVTYVTLSSISYSLIAPQFPADSHWINISSGGATSRDAAWSRATIANASKRVLVAPSVIQQTAQGQPTPEVREAIDALLGPHGMALEPGAACEVRHSRGIAAIATHNKSADKPAESLNKYSFWLCPLRYPVEFRPAQKPAVAARVEQAFEKMEQLCPRFFRPGESGTQRIHGGALRQYGGSDMKVYVLDDGMVLYKFWRALNPVVVGTIDDVLAGKASVQCDKIRGRSGLPWEREI